MGLKKGIITRDDIVKHKLSEYIDSKLEKPEAYTIHIKSKSEGIYGAQYFMTTSLHDRKLYVVHYDNRVREDNTYSIIINEYDCISELNSFDITQEDINNTYYSLYPDKNEKCNGAKGN